MLNLTLDVTDLQVECKKHETNANEVQMELKQTVDSLEVRR